MEGNWNKSFYWPKGATVNIEHHYGEVEDYDSLPLTHLLLTFVLFVCGREIDIVGVIIATNR